MKSTISASKEVILEVKLDKPLTWDEFFKGENVPRLTEEVLKGVMRKELENKGVCLDIEVLIDSFKKNPGDSLLGHKGLEINKYC